MRDAITGLIGRYDQLGRYLDRNAMDSIDGYLGEAELRLQAVELINREAAEIVREASQRLFKGDPELCFPAETLTQPVAWPLACGTWIISFVTPATPWSRVTARS